MTFTSCEQRHDINQTRKVNSLWIEWNLERIMFWRSTKRFSFVFFSLASTSITWWFVHVYLPLTTSWRTTNHNVLPRSLEGEEWLSLHSESSIEFAYEPGSGKRLIESQVLKWKRKWFEKMLSVFTSRRRTGARKKSLRVNYHFNTGTIWWTKDCSGKRFVAGRGGAKHLRHSGCGWMCHMIYGAIYRTFYCSFGHGGIEMYDLEIVHIFWNMNCIFPPLYPSGFKVWHSDSFWGTLSTHGLPDTHTAGCGAATVGEQMVSVNTYSEPRICSSIIPSPTCCLFSKEFVCFIDVEFFR